MVSATGELNSVLSLSLSVVALLAARAVPPIAPPTAPTAAPNKPFEVFESFEDDAVSRSRVADVDDSKSLGITASFEVVGGTAGVALGSTSLDAELKL